MYGRTLTRPVDIVLPPEEEGAWDIAELDDLIGADCD